MNQRAILYALVAIIGIPVLIQIAAWSATDPLLAGAASVFAISLLVLTQLGRNCWLLIPFFAPFTGAMVALPGNFAPRDIVIGIVALILPALWVVRRFPIRFRMGNLEIALLVLLLFLFQAFVRNPTGLSIFGSGIIGGRPYFEIAVSIAAFVILSSLLVDAGKIKAMVWAMFAGSMLVALYGALIGVFPLVALYTGRIYQSEFGSLSIRQYYLGAAEEGAGRLVWLKGFPTPILQLVFSFKAPLQLLIPKNIGWLLLVLFAGGCILFSGFRSGIAGAGLMAIAAFFFHRKPLQLVAGIIMGVPVLAAVLMLQGSLFELPMPAQRALSFLPAEWDQRAVRSAEGSSEWRFEMWETALTSDRYIRNKMFGDGFGFTAKEMAYQTDMLVKGRSHENLQEYYLATGTYHSGPVETIKRIGYAGLLALLVVMGVFMVEAARVVKRARGTPYFHYAIFVALPLVIHPFIFIFVFGSFKASLTTFCLGGGMLRLITNSQRGWEASRARARQESTARTPSAALIHAGSRAT